MTSSAEKCGKLEGEKRGHTRLCPKSWSRLPDAAPRLHSHGHSDYCSEGEAKEATRMVTKLRSAKSAIMYVLPHLILNPSETLMMLCCTP